MLKNWNLIDNVQFKAIVTLKIDPKYQQRLNSMQTKYLKETGQHYWWRPGQESPDRAPEISSETLLTQ
jgi:hypothetical protein